jgi:hypothetical protein
MDEMIRVDLSNQPWEVALEVGHWLRQQPGTSVEKTLEVSAEFDTPMIVLMPKEYITLFLMKFAHLGFFVTEAYENT